MKLVKNHYGVKFCPDRVKKGVNFRTFNFLNVLEMVECFSSKYRNNLLFLDYFCTIFFSKKDKASMDVGYKKD